MRRAGNLTFSRLMRLLTGWPIKDSQSGLFAANRDYLEVFAIVGDDNYAQQVLIGAYGKGMRFAHVPVAFHARKAGSSFVSLKYPFKVIPQMIITIAAVRPMKVFFPIGACVMLIATVVAIVELVEHLLGYSERPIQNVNLVIGTGLFGPQTIFFGVFAQLMAQGRNN